MSEYQTERHPLSAAFPDMGADEYNDLLLSINSIGIQNPIVLFEGKIIDGWHRYKASVELDVACPAIDMPEDVDVALYVIAQNIGRRSLTASQKAMAIVAVNQWRTTAGRSKKSDLEEPISKTNKELANLSQTSEQTIKRAKQVTTNAAPEVIEAVRKGEIGIVKASEIAKLDKDKQADAIKKPVTKKQLPKPEVAEYDEKDDLRETIDALNEELEKASRAAAAGVLAEGMESAKEIMERQSQEIKALQAENDGLKATRDTMMVEIKELKKQCSYYQKKLKELEK